MICLQAVPCTYDNITPDHIRILDGKYKELSNSGKGRIKKEVKQVIKKVRFTNVKTGEVFLFNSTLEAGHYFHKTRGTIVTMIDRHKKHGTIIYGTWRAEYAD
jgi:hypothetical protein